MCREFVNQRFSFDEIPGTALVWVSWVPQARTSSMKVLLDMVRRNCKFIGKSQFLVIFGKRCQIYSRNYLKLVDRGFLSYMLVFRVKNGDKILPSKYKYLDMEGFEI